MGLVNYFYQPHFKYYCIPIFSSSLGSIRWIDFSSWQIGRVQLLPAWQLPAHALVLELHENLAVGCHLMAVDFRPMAVGCHPMAVDFRPMVVGFLPVARLGTRTKDSNPNL